MRIIRGSSKAQNGNSGSTVNSSAYVSDYIDREKLHNMISWNPNFGKFHHYHLQDGMRITTTDTKRYENVGPYGAVDNQDRYWKVVVTPDDQYEVYETDVDGRVIGKPFPLDSSSSIQSASDADGLEDTDEVYDEIQEISQEFTSKNTSINSTKLPAVFNMVHFEPGTINCDYGGGRFDNVADYLTQYDVVNLVYDPFNRSAQHNKEVLKLIRRNGGADTVTLSNVLNVIKEPEARLNVLQNISKILKPDGTLYITVYEGKGTGEDGPTKSGYQLNRKTADYIEEIQQVFPNAKRKGKLIVANPGGAVESATSVTGEGEDDETNLGLVELDRRITEKVKEVMMSPEFGFSEEEVDQYSVVEVSLHQGEDDEYGNGDYIDVEIRAEASYDGMDMLAEACNPIVEEYDDGAYFDHVTGGIIEARLRAGLVLTASTDVTAASDEGNVIDIRDMAGMSKDEIKAFLDDAPVGSTIINVCDHNDRYGIDTTIRKSQAYEPNYHQGMSSPLDWKNHTVYWEEDGYKDPYIVGTVYDILNGTSKYYMVSPRAVEASEDVTAANYGGAYDIDPQEYFTKEDLVDFGEQVCDKLRTIYPGCDFEISYLDKTGAKVELEISEPTEQVSAGVTFQVDMRRIQKPSDISKYLDIVVEHLQPDLDAYLKTDVESGTDIEAGMYDVPDRPLDPPEPKEYDSADMEQEVLIELRDVYITVDTTGSWEYTDESWSHSDDNKAGDWYSEQHNIRIADPNDIVEAVDDLIEPSVPGVAGNYIISCDVKLVYTIEGIEFDRTPIGDGDYDEDVYTDNVDVSLVKDACEVSNFESKDA